MKDTDLAWMVPPQGPTVEAAYDLDPEDEWVVAAQHAVDKVNKARLERVSREYISAAKLLTPPKAPTFDWEDLESVASCWAPPTVAERCGHPLHSMAAFEAAYKLQGEVGKGGFASVHTCTRRRTGAVYAVKRMHASERIDAKELRAEAELMQRLDHPHVIHTIDAYYGAVDAAGRPEVWLIEEYASGGELFGWCRKRMVSSPPRARSHPPAARALAPTQPRDPPGRTPRDPPPDHGTPLLRAMVTWRLTRRPRPPRSARCATWKSAALPSSC